ncbi:MAG: NAD+ synthase [Alphaproteobacteria bacterium]
MTDRLSIALAQLNPTVGDIDGNLDKVLTARADAAAQGAELVLCTEQIVSGYPPEDLVLKGAFLDAIADGVRRLAEATGDGGPGLLVGAPWREEGACHNSALLLDGGAVASVRHKVELPNYGVFDEKRVFAAGLPPGPMGFRGVRLGVGVCEDMWTPAVSETLAESGAEFLVFINASPFERDKLDLRVNLAVARVTETGLPLVYTNQVGGQDELVFDGASFVLNADRTLAAQAPSFREAVTLTRWRRRGEGWQCEAGAVAPPLESPHAIYQAMLVGLRDYVNKNGFPGVVLGLSGGVDSALTAAVGVDALGADRVQCVMLPSPFTSEASLKDAAAVARKLGTRLDTVSILPAMEAHDDMLRQAFNEPVAGVTKENIQARARAVTLMAISNASGTMLLTTGNKSEMSVGYATLYGDMCGGYSVLKDIYKTDVFALCHWRNAHRPEGALGPSGAVIPERVITKPPSAELRPDQRDEDTLPPYADLDRILQGLVEEDLGVAEVAAQGHDRATVERVWRMLERAEYKRRQAPPGVKITRRAFGRDRRYPITNAFTGEA